MTADEEKTLKRAREIAACYGFEQEFEDSYQGHLRAGKSLFEAVRMAIYDWDM